MAHAALLRAVVVVVRHAMGHVVLPLRTVIFLLRTVIFLLRTVVIHPAIVRAVSLNVIPPPSYLNQVRACQPVTMVESGDLQFADLRRNAIATRGLTGGTAVAIMSTQSAILVHIPTECPDRFCSPQENIRGMMREVSRMFNHYRGLGYFPQTGALVIPARNQGSLWLGELVGFIRGCARQIVQRDPEQCTYHIPADLELRGHGEFVIEPDPVNPHAYPTLHLENERIS